MKLVNQYQEKDKIKGQLLVASCLKGITNGGLSYLNLELRDNTGSIIAKKWDVKESDEETFIQGNVVEVEGEIILYKNVLQMKVTSARKIPQEEIDYSLFVKSSPFSEEELKKKFKYYYDSVSNKDCKEVLKRMINRIGPSLLTFPAAITIHHDYIRGLMTHITSMCDLAEFIASHYENVDKDLLITGVIIHDLGKTIEYEGPYIFKQTLEGKLVGHISIGMAILKEECENISFENPEIPILLEHMVLSHHGQYEYGSPVLPMTKEALILNLIDNLDSRIVAINKGLENVKEGEFSQKLFAFDNRSFYNPKK